MSRESEIVVHLELQCQFVFKLFICLVLGAAKIFSGILLYRNPIIFIILHRISYKAVVL